MTEPSTDISTLCYCDPRFPGQPCRYCRPALIAAAREREREAEKKREALMVPVNPFKEYRKLMFYVLGTFVLLRWSWVTTYCIIQYNGGRVLQCSYEPLYLPNPDGDKK